MIRFLMVHTDTVALKEDCCWLFLFDILRKYNIIGLIGSKCDEWIEGNRI